jgi:acetone carboxylase gamma subunit
MYVINETAELVKCLCCGAEKYSTRKPFICHKCWRTGRAAEHMQQLTQAAPDVATTRRRMVACPNCETMFGVELSPTAPQVS